MTIEELESYKNSNGYVRLRYGDRFLDLSTKYIRERRWDVIGKATQIVSQDECYVSDIKLEKSVDPTEETIWPKENEA